MQPPSILACRRYAAPRYPTLPSRHDILPYRYECIQGQVLHTHIPFPFFKIRFTARARRHIRDVEIVTGLRLLRRRAVIRPYSTQWMIARPVPI
jgi:hypothetical protein